jgi:CRISPR-associated protein Cas1
LIKHIIEVSKDPTRLSVRNNQLVVSREGKATAQIPCEDIGVVIVDQPFTVYTHQLLCHLSANDTVVILCGKDHLPSSMLLPLGDHSSIVSRLQLQIDLKVAIRKRLWKQLVREKILRQAMNLNVEYPAHNKLLEIAATVKSGDTTNREAYAARVYWQNWLWQEEFRRDRNEPGINSMLNYGYAIVRAALARCVVAAGLQPSLGLMHKHRANAFCLVDDLIEPFRPWVDSHVRELYLQGYTEIGSEVKEEILGLLMTELVIDQETGPAMVMMHRYVSSLVHCMDGSMKTLQIPRPC